MAARPFSDTILSVLRCTHIEVSDRNKAIVQLDELEALMAYTETSPCNHVDPQLNAGIRWSNDDVLFRWLAHFESSHPSTGIIPSFEGLDVTTAIENIRKVRRVRDGINGQWQCFEVQARYLNHPSIDLIWSSYRNDRGYYKAGFAACRSFLTDTSFSSNLEQVIAFAGLVYAILTLFDGNRPFLKESVMEPVLYWLSHTLGHEEQWSFHLLASHLWHGGRDQVVMLQPETAWNHFGMFPTAPSPSQDPSPRERLAAFVRNLFELINLYFDFQSAGILEHAVVVGSSSAYNLIYSRVNMEEVQGFQEEPGTKEPFQDPEEFLDDPSFYNLKFAEQDAECNDPYQSSTTLITRAPRINEANNERRRRGRRPHGM